MSNFEFVVGPMFAGKSTYAYNKIKSIGTNVPILLISPNLDTRQKNDNTFWTHNGRFPIPKNVKLIKIVPDQLPSILVSAFKFVIISEAQFFGKSLLKFLSQNHHYNSPDILCEGLLYDYKQQQFGNIYDAIQKWNTVAGITNLFSKCHLCKSPAWYTVRKIESDEKILIGGKNIYQPACIKCLKHF